MRFQKVELSIELRRQRKLLLANSKITPAADVQPEICSDLTDRASIDLEQRLAMLVKVRTIDKLRRIECALQMIRTNSYGQCRRCHGDIPYDRLKVQPDALMCVPCLSRAETQAAN
ncbi:MAG: TraR/DksA C4-type zinc finger protein [Nitrospira sp.]|nr:TraR/DksA C4-type zinc finger protein [Nitrospira sp.]